VKTAVALIVLLFVSGCAKSSTNEVVNAPTQLRMPDAGQRRWLLQTTPRPGARWRRTSIHGTTYFVRGNVIFALRSGTSPLFTGGFPYLEVVNQPSAARRAAQDAAPPDALAVVHREFPDPQKRLDFTFLDKGQVRLASDARGPQIVAVYEPSCVACNKEIEALKRVSDALSKKGGQTFLITSARSIPESARRRVGSRVHVVVDRDHSVYGVLNVHNIPLNYFARPDGRLSDIEVGRLNDDDYFRYLAEIVNT
jgi:hypothetical protein